ncbi:MAG: Fic family protein [Blastocatellia bacterium]|nr:Fic family protein [Blastocatellia bacterium]
MSEKTKTEEIGKRILRLLDEEPEVSVRLIAQDLGVSKDNRTELRSIQRALRSLVEKNQIRPKGAGRSRVYILGPSVEVPGAAETREASKRESSFAAFDLSPESSHVLNYVSQDLSARTPVGYNQDFLRSYEPNKTYYLSAAERERLLTVGRVEAIERPAGTYARNILDRLLIDLSWNSSRLEGNTYSLLETKRLIELGETAVGKDASEAQMILNHKAAIEYIVETAEEESISSHEICSIHALLSENLLGDPAASGRLRSIAVGVSGTAYIPLDNPHILRECFDLFVEKLNLITDPFERSLFSIVHLSYLQAFEDVNKRTARLVANVPLTKENLRPLSFADVNQATYVSALLGVYELNNISLIRDLYIWAYRRSSQRYTAIQQAMGEPNLLKLRYRPIVQEIVRMIILEKVPGPAIVEKIRESVDASDVPASDREALFNLIEVEVISLHEGSVARFKVRPSEFQAWKAIQ